MHDYYLVIQVINFLDNIISVLFFTLSKEKYYIIALINAIQVPFIEAYLS